METSAKPFMRNAFLTLLGLSLVTSIVGCKKTESAKEAEVESKGMVTEISNVPKVDNRPNLLFIMTDQHRFDVMSIAGNSIIQTPNMDRIGREGVYFENAYTHCPVCVPARMSLLAGLSSINTKVRINGHAGSATLAEGFATTETYDEVLAAQGYYSEYHGKWHAPLYRTSIYKEFLSGHVNPKNGKLISSGLGDYIPYLDRVSPLPEDASNQLIAGMFYRPYIPDPIDPLYGKSLDSQKRDKNGMVISGQANSYGELLLPPEHSRTAFTAEQTIEAMKRAKTEGKPFTITCSFGPPHPPMVVTKPYYGMYPADKMEPEASIDDLLENSPYYGKKGTGADSTYRDKEKIKYMMSNYYGLVREVDDWIGKLLDTLEDIGEADNTLVIYTSDHGEMLGAHGLNGKGVFYEEAIHIPLLMKFPGKIKPGTVVKDPVSHLDVYATILDYLGAGNHKSDGESLRPIVEGRSKKTGERYAVVEWNTTPDFCITTTEWKLIYSRTEGTIDCLYNLKEDPKEINNLIGKNPDRMKHEEQVEKLKSYLVEYLEKVNHPYLEDIKKKPIICAPSETVVQQSIKSTNSQKDDDE